MIISPLNVKWAFSGQPSISSHGHDALSDSVIQDYLKEELKTVMSNFAKWILPLISDKAALSVLYSIGKNPLNYLDFWGNTIFGFTWRLFLNHV